MDRSHKLDAPNNEELSGIEQVDDHSNLSTLYPHAHDQWTGELVGKLEREDRQQKAQDTISFGIRKHFVTIGFLIPFPFIIAAFVTLFILLFINDDNVTLFVIPAIFAFFSWVGLTFVSYRKVHTLFYKNAVRTVPYIFILFSLLALSIPIFYELTLVTHQDRLVFIALIVGLLVLLWSIVLSFVLLRIWTTPVISGNVKVLCITTIGLLLAATAAYLTFLL